MLLIMYFNKLKHGNHTYRQLVYDILRIFQGIITLTWSQFNLEYTPNCNKDYIELRERSPTGRLLGRHCGQASVLPITASYNGPIYMFFHTDATVAGGSWYVSWTSSCKLKVKIDTT